MKTLMLIVGFRSNPIGGPNPHHYKGLLLLIDFNQTQFLINNDFLLFFFFLPCYAIEKKLNRDKGITKDLFKYLFFKSNQIEIVKLKKILIDDK